MLALPLVVVFSNSDSDGTVVGSVVTAACAAGSSQLSSYASGSVIRPQRMDAILFFRLSSFFSFSLFFFSLGKKMSEERALAVAVVIPCEEER